MFYLCAYPNQQQCHKRKRFVELIGHPICHSNEVTICPLLKIETAAKAKEKDRKEEMTVEFKLSWNVDTNNMANTQYAN